MNKITGKVLLEETGTGLPNLLITVYDVDLNSLPEAGFRTNQPTLVTRVWDQLQGNRLGSVLTDAEGAFLLEYDDREVKAERPDLLLFVTAPEGPGVDGCSPILHVSCGIRQNAGRIESYLIRLTTAALKIAGVPLPFVPIHAAAASKALPQRLLAMEVRKRETRHILAKVRSAWHQDAAAAPKISEVYRQKVRALQKTAAKRRLPTNGFRFALPVLSTGEDGQARMAFDAAAKKWFMQKGAEQTEVKFGGIVSTDDLKPDARPTTGISIVLDEQKKEFRIAIARAPVRLCMTENSPGELFIETFRRRFVTAKKPSKPTETVSPNEAGDQQTHG